MADLTERYRLTPLHVIKSRAIQLAYLGDAGKVLVALANEYGPDRPMPSRAYVQRILDLRAAGRKITPDSLRWG